jgi:cyclopropane fatty-acyl-phospholipid synthase-like methyltransferase
MRAPVLHLLLLLLVSPLLGSLAGCAQPQATALPAVSTTEKNVRPGINKGFLSPKLDIKKSLKKFEGESREIFAHRHRIVNHLEIAPGMTVADIGAGTGLFLSLLAKKTAPDGKVYAVDISPTFVDFLEKRCREKALHQVQVVLCKRDSVELPAASVDLVFVCDTYHHFEYPRSTLATIHRALRPGGRMVLVDFDRLPNKSRKWVLDHVRAGKQVFTAEIKAAGFVLEDEVKVKGLRENYLLRFRRN